MKQLPYFLFTLEGDERHRQAKGVLLPMNLGHLETIKNITFPLEFFCTSLDLPQCLLMNCYLKDILFSCKPVLIILEWCNIGTEKIYLKSLALFGPQLP